MKRFAFATALIVLLAFSAHQFARPVLAQVRAALTQNVDEPGRNGLSFSGQNTKAPTYTYSFTVPAGQRYVVENYSVQCAEGLGGSLSDLTLTGSTGGVPTLLSTTAHSVRPADIFVDGFGATIYRGSGSGPLYADAGSTITLTASDGSRGTGDGPCQFYISGHTLSTP